MKDIKKASKMTIILYFCATLMTLCTMFMIYKSNTYISSLVSQGLNPSKEIAEVINYYLATVAPFIFYTIALFSLGYIMNKIDNIINNKEIVKENNICSYKESEDDEIDDLFSNIE